MPYRKRRRTYYRKKKKYTRKNIFWHRLRNKAVRGGLRALKYLNVEEKPIDTLLADTVTTTFGVTELVNTTQGDAAGSRDGNQIKLTSIFLRYTLKVNVTAVSNISRIMIVLDKQSNGATVTPADVLADVSAGDAIVSPYNLDNKYRFKILYDRRITTTSGPLAIRNPQWYRKLNMHIRYDGNAGTVTDLTSRNLVLMTVGDQATNGAALNAFVRVRFVDN